MPHIPVLMNAVCARAQFHAENPVVVDATLGGAGHAAALVERMPPGGVFIGIDRDPEALIRGRERLAGARCAVYLHHGEFSELPEVLDRRGVSEIDFLLADLGVSSFQLDEADRGFSFSADGPLDMRMNPEAGETLLEKLSSIEYADLASILRRFGEEPAAGPIARSILRALEQDQLHTTADLAAAVTRVVPSFTRNLHPATKTFQALRIWVNGELEEVEALLAAVPELLTPGGRMLVISFHSLEDRLAKQAFAKLCHPERDIPSWVPLTRDQMPKSRFWTEGPIGPDADELEANPRSRSAKLRVLWTLEDAT
ncbi:16S rRNA (cytosine(1402)-N(4))-methyltransferase RsmH [Myxococcota bacterium]|nr:16S rRNA (cytosine(1402)-N(4))-methyltransferase RsmH [Myxococcota bacterium]MBU1413527.1 16S rRNA (cytosine(1402)-N(4))-methyltransferase RsmH [Myxococcota bacterium]MBU1511252.1 16S rRNA (cytosine(1402)-N(4))-methyltransferase RsmH [Myxococcota bacterium]